MKSLQFISLLIRRGTLIQKPLDFESKRREVVETLQVTDSIVKNHSRVKRNNWLWSVPGAYSLVAAYSLFKNRRNMNKMYYVSDTHRVVYVRTLKTAGTSVLAEFLGLLDNKVKGMSLSDEQVDALGYYFAKRNIPAEADKYEKFAIVRDPYQRIVSVYLDLFDPASEIFSYEAYLFGILKRGMSFKDFISVISKIPTTLLGPHFCPQHIILKETNDIKVFRLEEEKEELKGFLRRYGIALAHRNKHKTPYDYRSFYNKEIFGMVKALYSGDVSQFGYVAAEKGLERFLTN